VIQEIRGKGGADGLGGRHRREAESVLDVLDGRALCLTPEARDWLEGLALQTTLTGGHARGLLLTCGGGL